MFLCDDTAGVAAGRAAGLGVDEDEVTDAPSVDEISTTESAATLAMEEID